MREIRFRAKAINDGFYKGGWVYGYYLKSLCGGELVDVITDGAHEIPIQVDTLGQFTGLQEKDGKEIHEGDIVFYNTNEYEVVFKDGAFFIEELVSRQHIPFCYITGKNMSVIRSKYDE